MRLWPIQLHVGSVERSSAVIVGGCNVVYGLSSHEKSNVGFGDIGSQSFVSQNRVLLYDPDGIDMPVDDRDTHVLQTRQQAPTDTHIHFQGLAVNSMQQNAGVFVGDAQMTGWDQHQKSNKASGDIGGDHNVEIAGVHVNYDADAMDGIFLDSDYKAGTFVRQG
ncbi:hypothetical protein [Alicyclobacillus vulcanalis]|uniref:hypothetical protein n=1 Tax=Alicyclobacillus vulcanalis TaxID=252246 RepID=UPI000970E7B3|nr:hypothetical protein [Alicyclobacillus vulcanalis]